MVGLPKGGGFTLGGTKGSESMKFLWYIALASNHLP